MATASSLGVWLGEIRVADVEQPRWPRISLRYAEEALASWPQNSPLISCWLPLGRRPGDALPFCLGLLPEGQALATMAAQAGLAANDVFGLLGRYGRDVAGALVIGTEAPEPRGGEVEPYEGEGLAEAVEDLEEHPLGAHEDSELALAGLQDKLLLVRLPDGGWGRPLRGRPSTHILKREDTRFPGLIEAEAECLAIARAVSLTTVEAETVELGGYSCLIVSRFDRVVAADGEVRRIHQEDLCQALGIDPSGARGRAKYEQGAAGPSLRQAAELLDGYGADPLAELDRLVAVTAYTVAIGNADAHGKNLALLHPDPGTISLAPLYDTVPTVLWPRLRSDAAMAIGGQVALGDVGLEDIVREGVRWSHPADRARRVATETLEGIATALEAGVVRTDGDVGRLVAARTRALLAGKAAGA
ncbi:MAG TPA: HipA domain-containing protein [Solirubrobacterales bacterium]|jgi:serine/threonine-protein kinase HipA